MKIHLVLILFFIPVIGLAQVDSIAYSRDFEFIEGIYLTLDQFKQNNSIRKSAIVSSYPSTQPDFFSQIFDQKILNFKDASGVEQKLEKTKVWAYCQNRSVFINFNSHFNRLNVIGTLCHFTSTVSTTIGYHDPMNYNYGLNNSVEELKQFVLNTKTNQVLDFNIKNMESILQDDVELYNQFMTLKKREKQNAIFIYLRKYNEKHPLYLPAK